MTSSDPLIIFPVDRPQHIILREEGQWLILQKDVTIVLCLRCLHCKQVILNPGVEGVDAAQYPREIGRCRCDDEDEEDGEERVAHTVKHVDGGQSVYFDFLYDGSRYTAIGFQVDESELDAARQWLGQRQEGLRSAWEAHCKGTVEP